MKRYLKPVIAGVILLATVGSFTWYLRGHPEIIDQIKNVNPLILGVLITCYSVWFAALAVILQLSLRMYNKTMPVRENALLSAYSSLLNFFGPGQSGPGLRGIYLKKRHGLGIKKYIFATLIYYACYALISAVMLLSGRVAWWLTFLAGVLVITGCAVILQWYAKRSAIEERASFVRYIGLMFIATAVQLAAQAVIYYVELQAISSVSIGQAVSYTGAANFSLFVALTPGAIGIREAFLLFTQNIHHISSSVIVAANVIDRAAYLVFLGLLAIGVFGLHADKKLRLKQMTQE
jgi:uncharacterized membrane protein YbhN (UPF0104 family)